MSLENIRRLQDQLKQAEKALSDAETAAVNSALSGLRYNPSHPFKEVTQADLTPTSAASPSAVVLAGQHLGARPATDARAVLERVSVTVGVDQNAASERLRAVADDHRLKGRLARSQIYGDQDLALVLSGMLLHAL